MKRYHILFTAAIILLGTSTNGQDLILDIEKSSIVIMGTSSLHDWKSDVEEIKASGTITRNGESLSLTKPFEIIVSVKSIKGDKSGMDKRTYDALKEENYPEISFEVLTINSAAKGGVDVQGNLSIAGKTQSTTVSFKMTEELRYEGKVDIQLPDYDIEPPTALFGTIKVDEMISIVIRAVFKTAP